MSKFLAPTTPEISEREIRNSAKVRELATECMVILKNDGTLPLKKVGKIALYGIGARSTVKGGTGSGDVYVRKSLTIEEGLKEEGFDVTTTAWMDLQIKTTEDEHAAYNAKCAEEAKALGQDPGTYTLLKPFIPKLVAPISEEDVKNSDTDTAVFVVARNSGEGKDRTATEGDYLLSEGELGAIRFLAEHYEKTIVLLNIGGIIDTKGLRAIEGVNSIVLSNQMGNITGLTVADLLKGTHIPSGRLTDTWAENYSDYPSSETFGMNDGDVNDEYYTEGIYVGYRYFDTFNVTPAYEFGYGLNYTDFDIADVNVSVEKDEIIVSAKVTNIGKEYPGKEVVQVYVSAPAGKIDKPYQELRAFAKTKELKPGESQTLTMKIKAASLASYCDECCALVLEAGDYIVRVGKSSRKTHAAAVITLDETKAVKKYQHLYKDPAGSFDELKPNCAPYSYAGEADEIAKAPKLSLKAADIESVEVKYLSENIELEDKHPDHVIMMDEVAAGKYTVEELVAQLTPEELTYACVGNSIRNSGLMDVLGNASKNLPGSAGETTDHMVESRNMKCMQLCDGPAGLRVMPEFIELPDGSFFGLTKNGLKMDASQLPDGIHHYQYCTAIPIAFALASSWNMDLISQFGDIVGDEMDAFGVALWLAPGMNVHRNPLCGRNFEYYSEDPMLAGKCAAADTKGVQQHPGKGTTIKHFLTNNQEDNRMFTNSHVSERALREIYLKNFQVAVEEGQPMSLMTSYNLMNGTHTANRKDTVTNVLRDEWNFQGMVVTDWLTTSPISKMLSAIATESKYDCADAALCIKAGNDLVEPGEMHDIEVILKGYEDGVINKADLQKCATHVIGLLAKSCEYSDKSYYDTTATKTITFTAE